jgi:Endonuclease/Exonuclease/phosphatase family.
MEQIQPQHATFVCGDFNARIKTSTPLLDHTHPPRIATDTHMCTRAPWLIELCELNNLYILNGIHSPAAYTCHTSRGESTVDYILCSKVSLQVNYTPLQVCNITDHDLLSVTLPISAKGGTSSKNNPPRRHPQQTPRKQQTIKRIAPQHIDGTRETA